MTFTKDYKFGECVLAANEYNDANGKLYFFYVLRCLKTNTPTQTNEVPFAYFKNDPKINSHCFLRHPGGFIVDPLFKQEDIDLFTYVQYIADNHLNLTEHDPRYIIIDIQELRDEFVKINRAQFVNNEPYFGVLYDRINKSHQLIGS
mgnify:CR=1 FL=1